MRPAALTNMPLIDEKLGNIAVNFWDLTWNDNNRHLPYEIRLLLSLTNAVGAGRMRQATRELVKAYIQGLDSAALDDVFELLAWNQGIGYFSSEIGPSTLFAAYKGIKNMASVPRTIERKGSPSDFAPKSFTIRSLSFISAKLNEPPGVQSSSLSAYTQRICPIIAMSKIQLCSMFISPSFSPCISGPVRFV